MTRILKRWALVLALIAGLLWLGNTSLLIDREDAAIKLIAHRGLGQTFPTEGLTGETCTAARIYPPEHPYLENTIESMRAAFDHGAWMVELDVHPTRDGEWAVFHDWGLECRTDGEGVVRDQTMEYLRTLDVGFGYTADSGKTFPFRGRGVGLMPSLTEVLESFPGRQFLINVKGGGRGEGERLATYLADLPEKSRLRLSIYGNPTAIEPVLTRHPTMRFVHRPALKNCLSRYLALGWSGHVPESCEGLLVTVPANLAPLMWGWPDRFLDRIESAGSEVILINDYTGRNFTEGIDTVDGFREKVPPGYTGGVWTNRIDVIARAVQLDVE